MLKSASDKKVTSYLPATLIKTKNKTTINNQHNYSNKTIPPTPIIDSTNYHEIELVKCLDMDLPINTILQRAHSREQLKQSVELNYEKVLKRRGVQLLKLPSLNNANQSSIQSSSNIFDKKKINQSYSEDYEKEYKDIKQQLSILLTSKRRNIEIINNRLREIDDDKMQVEILEKGAMNLSKDTSITNQPKGISNIFKFGMLNIMKGLHPPENKSKTSNKERVLKEIEEKKETIKALRLKNTELSREIAVIKANFKEIKAKVLRHYTRILYEGIHCGKEGLSWIIKAIWNIGENVLDDFLPSFLDTQSIDYLFTVTKMSLEINDIRNEIIKEKTILKGSFGNKNNNKPVDLFKTKLEQQKNLYKERKYYAIEYGTDAKDDLPSRSIKLVNQWLAQREKIDEDTQLKLNVIERLHSKQKEIEGEMRKLRNAEMERIFKEFILNNYENRYQVSIETVISALVGEVNKDREMVKFNRTKKIYFDTIKKAQFYSYFVDYEKQSKKE